MTQEWASILARRLNHKSGIHSLPGEHYQFIKFVGFSFCLSVAQSSLILITVFGHQYVDQFKIGLWPSVTHPALIFTLSTPETLCSRTSKQKIYC